MDQISNAFTDIYAWAKRDYKEYPLRFILEITAWVLSIGCAIVMAITVPTPPMLMLYPIFMTQCIIFGWSAWTRGSLGMLSNYGLLVTIDSVGLFRMLSN
jgi:hypothetical protein